MAQELADGEFWLPPEFLNDEDILMDFTHLKPNSGGPNSGLSNGSSGFHGLGSYGPHSGLSSPVDSTETESDEEDYLNGLTQKLANTTLKGDFWKTDANFNFQNKAARVVAGSPQSTLCGCKQGSSRGSPNCVSPPAMAVGNEQNHRSLDLLYAAAGEVARMRMIEEAASRYYNPSKTHVATQPTRKSSNPSLHYQQLQAAQFQQLKELQIAKQNYMQMMLQSRGRNEVRNDRPFSPSTPAWVTAQQAQPPAVQRQTSSGMRAVFLGNPTAKRESTGTGVFLPRQPGAPTEPAKKRGCSTVLLPDRVVRALDLNLEAIGEAEMIYRRSLMMAQQRRNDHRQQAASINEFRLPQEWTY